MKKRYIVIIIAIIAVSVLTIPRGKVTATQRIAHIVGVTIVGFAVGKIIRAKGW